MPLYEYQCDACGNRFELIRKFSDPPLDTCPKCGVAGQVHKLVSSPAFQFKGSGWYVTDYANKKSSEPSSSGKSSDEKSSSKTESKADTAARDTSSTASDKPAAATPATSSTTKDK